jgi:N utilization substance protein A
MSVGRDAGERTKIAVFSRDRDVDPVGACVGMKGSRVQSVIRELRGEKIDIVQYHDEPQEFVREALKPAAINRVNPKDPETREMEVIVIDDQLSLAIGKKGQNVRLAGRLVGWRIDIKSESEKRAEVDAEMESLARAREELGALGLEAEALTRLLEAGFRSASDIATADFEDLARIPGIDEEAALAIFDAALVAAEAAEIAAAEAAEAEEAAGEAGGENELPGEAEAEGLDPLDAALAQEMAVGETIPETEDVPAEKGNEGAAASSEGSAPAEGRDEE